MSFRRIPGLGVTVSAGAARAVPSKSLRVSLVGASAGITRSEKTFARIRVGTAPAVEVPIARAIEPSVIAEIPYAAGGIELSVDVGTHDSDAVFGFKQLIDVRTPGYLAVLADTGAIYAP